MIPANGRANAAYSTQTSQKGRANARATRSGPVRPDIASKII